MLNPWILAIRSARPQRRLAQTLKARPTCLSLSVIGSRRYHQTTSTIGPRPPSDAVANMAPKAPKFEIKTPKGTRDWSGPDMVLREKIFKTITDVFKRHGGVTIDTPVFELKEILAGKYGEDSKLIYDLADQGGELCSLRYDLTVPFARYLAMNKDVTQIKRYHLAKVYRRDQPAVKKGRMREFYQCDFDIAGVYDPMIPDAEIIRIINEVFEGLGWKGNYTIKLNSRKILDGIFQVCGVPDNLIRPVSSAVDKLDKMPWEDVRKEMVDEKGLAPEAADKIGQYVVLKGKRDLLEKLQKDEALAANPSMQQGFADMELLFEYLDAFGADHSVSFDLSLARGLDYYTGIIYEVVTEGSAPKVSGSDATAEKAKKKKGKSGDADEDRSDDPTVGIGSVAAGGRYDNLVGMFSGKTQVPCVGISFGIDRIFSIMRANQAKKDRKNEVDVFVMAFGGGKDFTGLLKERSQACARLWDAGIKAEFLYKVKPKLQNQFKAAENNGVPFALILGEDELAQGKVKIKEMGLPDDHPLKEGELVSFDNLIYEVQSRLDQKKRLDSIAERAEGLRVVGGIKGEDIKASVAADTAQPASGKSSETVV
ncbi:putative mitochondrial histidyl-tRNA synthetase precursor [Cladorrhinum sp. PSN259]|nr:putative mitochondrial histidyl-tRNA synthetase precursor [Cladorrhinum sp. PSN259]